jgi:hypothetical protein
VKLASVRLQYAVENTLFEIMEHMDKAELTNLVASNSPRVSFQVNKNATSNAWNSFAFVLVDGAFSVYLKRIDCNVLLKWKHRDGTSGLMNHTKACRKNKAEGVESRKLTDFVPVSAVNKPDAAIPGSVKSEVADAAVMMCATDIR